MKLTAAVLLSLVLFACDDLEFRLDRLTVSSSAGSYVNIGIKFTWGNHSGRTVYVDRCRSRLERRTSSGWRTEADHACTTSAVEVPPGARIADTSFASVRVPAGEYRGVFHVSDTPTSATWDAVYSNVFLHTRTQ